MAVAIEFDKLTKEYDGLLAVDELSASIESGRITGFLGPNGAGKSTALRCLLGLAKPTSGSALIEGSAYGSLLNPLQRVGAVIDSAGFHGSLSAQRNLLIICAAAEIPDLRVMEVLTMVDLEDSVNKKVKEFSLGMKQRLSLAAALLSDPDILILDEPANGLDPIGIAWLRDLLRSLAQSGKTVLVSSHQLAEMQNSVDDVLVINKGKLIVAGQIDEVRQGQSLEEAFLRYVQR
jgi:ABC-2 type transport system ATP-binding protein